MIDAETLAGWKTVAEAATPGPWILHHERSSHPRIWGDVEANPDDPAAVTEPCSSYANAEHIATFDPPTILALIAEMERLQAAHRSTRTLAEWNADQASVAAERCNKACAERDALQAQVDAVKALADDWRYKGEFGWGPWQAGEGPDPEGYVLDHAASELLAALGEAGGDRD